MRHPDVQSAYKPMPRQGNILLSLGAGVHPGVRSAHPQGILEQGSRPKQEAKREEAKQNGAAFKVPYLPLWEFFGFSGTTPAKEAQPAHVQFATVSVSISCSQSQRHWLRERV